MLDAIPLNPLRLICKDFTFFRGSLKRYALISALMEKKKKKKFWAEISLERVPSFFRSILPSKSWCFKRVLITNRIWNNVFLSIIYTIKFLPPIVLRRKNLWRRSIRPLCLLICESNMKIMLGNRSLFVYLCTRIEVTNRFLQWTIQFVFSFFLFPGEWLIDDFEKWDLVSPNAMWNASFSIRNRSIRNLRVSVCRF